MPGGNGSLNIFNLDTAAGFDEGFIKGHVGAGARWDATGSLEVCHGVDLSLESKAMLKATADLNLLWLVMGNAEGQALAEAGLALNGKFDINLFDTFGFSVRAAAYADAALAGKLTLGLTTEIIEVLARDRLDDFSFDIFIAFLREISIGAGVWGKVSASVAAAGYLDIKGSLKEDDEAGFVIAAGGEVGMSAGAGYEFYAHAKIQNPKRFFLYASERTAEEIVSRLRPVMHPRYYGLLEVVQVTLPIVLNAAYQLAQYKIDPTIRREEVTKAITQNVTAQLQRYLLDKLVEAGIHFLGSEIDRQIDALIQDNLPALDKSKALQVIDQLIVIIRADGIKTANLDIIINLAIELIDAIGSPSEAQRKAITVTWLAFNTVEALRDGVQSGTATATAGLIFLGTGVAEAVYIKLQRSAPQLVKDEISRLLGMNVGQLDTSVAIDYLVRSDIAKDFIRRAPHVEILFDLLQLHLQLSPGEIFEVVLNVSLVETEEVTQLELYQKLKGLLKNLVDDCIHQQLIPELIKKVGPNHDLVRYINEVLSPSTKIVSGFVFTRIDNFINAGINGTITDGFDETFLIALSKIVTRIYSTNVLVISDILLNHVLDNMHVTFRNLAEVARMDPSHIFAANSMQLFHNLIPPILPGGADVSGACRELAANLLYAASDITGAQVYTHERRKRLFELYKRVFNALDPEMDNIALMNAESFFTQLLDCFYVPDLEALTELIQLQVEINVESLKLMIPQVTEAITLFQMQLTKASIEAMAKVLEQFLETLADVIHSAYQKIKELEKGLKNLIEAFQKVLNDSAASIDHFLAVLEDDATQNNIKDHLFHTGWRRAPDPLKGAYAIAFQASTPLFDLALERLVAVGREISTSLDSATDLPEVIEQIILEFGKQIADILTVDIGPLKLRPPLPSELSLDDIVASIESSLRDYTPLNHALDGAIAQKQVEIAKGREKRLAEENLENGKRKYAEANEQAAAFTLNEIEIEIVSPVPFVDPDSRKTLDWTYGKNVAVQLVINGASASFLSSSSPKRILIALNGQVFDYNILDWSISESGNQLTFNKILSSSKTNLKSGLNVIECSVVNGNENVVRQTVNFLMNPLMASHATVIFDVENSVVDTVGDDHKNTKYECVAFKNTGNMPLNLTGWWLTDRKRHTYIFPEFMLAPQETVSVFTGIGTDTPQALYRHRSQAIWNNTGDTVLLINDKKVLVLNHIY